jgi:hypothetical protein
MNYLNNDMSRCTGKTKTEERVCLMRDNCKRYLTYLNDVALQESYISVINAQEKSTIDPPNCTIKIEI